MTRARVGNHHHGEAKQKISIALTPVTIQYLEEQKKKTGNSRSEVVEQILREHIPLSAASKEISLTKEACLNFLKN